MKRKRVKRKNKMYGIFIFIPIIMLIGGVIIYLFNDHKNTVSESKKALTKSQQEVSKEEPELKLSSTPNNYLEFSSLEDGEYKTAKGYTLTIRNGLAYIEDMLIVNKTYSLPSTYQPENPYTAITQDRGVNFIDKDVMQAFREMQSDASSIGLNIYIASGYRSYNNQKTLYNNYVAQDGKEAADKYSARPGYSEHQTGLCFDLNSIDDSFANTDEGKWINENAYLYGFIIRYPYGKENETGYQYESWHLRYVGDELAKKLYNNGSWLTIEDYFGLTSSYE